MLNAGKNKKQKRMQNAQKGKKENLTNLPGSLCSPAKKYGKKIKEKAKWAGILEENVLYWKG